MLFMADADPKIQSGPWIQSVISHQILEVDFVAGYGTDCTTAN